MSKLRALELRGFKSIRDSTLSLRSLNVLIGANGAGKSNLVSFFKMLNEMMGERLQEFIGRNGHAQSILHFGPKVTPQLEAKLEFEVDNGLDIYKMRLFHAAGDTLVFAEENLSFLQSGWQSPKVVALGAGHLETRIRKKAEEGEPTAKVFRHLLDNCRVYHFHDTSSGAAVRQHCYIGDIRWLRPDGGNVAALLYRMRHEGDGLVYQRIVSTVRLFAPFIGDFDLEPVEKEIILNWKETGSDQIFGPHQLSDGTLRAICLTTLLLQPVERLPDLIIVDEPELGLHPFALNTIASLFSMAASHVQVLVSTQSTTFLDNFEPEDIVVVDRNGSGTTFTRLDSRELQSWLEEYSLGEIWEKNIIRGGPH